jgi:pyroglutamyl-peptidase
VRPVVLVTGFGPFLAHAENPSEHVAHQIAATNDLAPRFDALAPLPVALGDAAEIVLARVGPVPPRAILMLGLAAATPHVRIERVGRNRNTAPEADARGRRGQGAQIIEGGPDSIAAGVALAPLAHALTRHGIAWTYSDDAGGYVCNDLYYRVLALCDVPAVFVHVPKKAHESAKLSRALAEGMAAAIAASP